MRLWCCPPGIISIGRGSRSRCCAWRSVGEMSERGERENGWGGRETTSVGRPPQQGPLSPAGEGEQESRGGCMAEQALSVQERVSERPIPAPPGTGPSPAPAAAKGRATRRPQLALPALASAGLLYLCYFPVAW